MGWGTGWGVPINWSAPSLRLKLTAGYALAFVVAVMLGAILIYVVAAAELTRSLDTTLEETAAVTQGSIAGSGLQTRFAPGLDVRSDLSLELLTDQGQLVTHVGALHQLNLSALRRGFLTVGDWRVYSTPLPNGQWLRIMRPTDLLSGLLETLARVLIGAALLMIALSCVGGYILADRALRPVDEVARAAMTIARRGTYRERVPVAPGEDEFTRLSHAVNTMLDRLEKTIEHEKNFARMAAHELRTPLTALSGRVELLLDRPRDVAAYQAGVRQIQERVEALRSLSEGLLSLARTDAAVSLEPVELAGTVLAVVEDWRHEVRAAGKTLVLDVEEHWVTAELDGVRQVVMNLLLNAVNYGGAQITLRVRAGELTVLDNGPGPDQAEWTRLLRPLERGAGVQRVSGSGLGLAVVAALAQRWQAEVWPTWLSGGFQISLCFHNAEEQVDLMGTLTATLRRTDHGQS